MVLHMLPRLTLANINNLVTPILIIKAIITVKEGHLIGNNLRQPKISIIMFLIWTVSKPLSLAALKIQVSLILRFSLLNRIFNPRLQELQLIQKVKRVIPSGTNPSPCKKLISLEWCTCPGLSNLRPLIYRIINLILKVTNN